MNPLVTDEGVGESNVGKPLGLDEKYNDRHIHLLHRWVRVVNSQQVT